MYMCITESLCCTAEINTTLLINCTSIEKTKKINTNHPIFQHVMGLAMVCLNAALKDTILYEI